MKFLKVLKFYENFDFFFNLNFEIMRFLKILTFFVIWLADWKWNLVSGWTTLKHRIDNRQKYTQARIYLTRGVLTAREVCSLWGRVEKMLFRPISEKQSSLSFNKIQLCPNFIFQPRRFTLVFIRNGKGNRRVYC
jgi:hypothetical protein